MIETDLLIKEFADLVSADTLDIHENEGRSRIPFTRSADKTTTVEMLACSICKTGETTSPDARPVKQGSDEDQKMIGQSPEIVDLH